MMGHLPRLHTAFLCASPLPRRSLLDARFTLSARHCGSSRTPQARGPTHSALGLHPALATPGLPRPRSLAAMVHATCFS